ncbi:MAG: serine hydrolase [Saprospiraceae bacterium]|nr:serine hydrolase [Saprospiraceae bacterium]
MRIASLPLIFSLFFALPIFAQTDYSGNWKGAIELPGMNLEIAIDLKKEGGQWVGDLDIPAQQVKDMALADLKIEGRSMSFKLPEVPSNASFSGSFDEKGERLEGTFAQSGMSFPMKLARASAAEKAAEEKRLQDAIATLRHLADSLREKRMVPGLGFGMVKDGKVLLAEGYGYRDLEKKLPATANTQFAIGSSTKAFTAAGLAVLADKGQLEWEKPIIHYLPDFKLHDELATREMSAVDLLSHRSGLPRHDFMWYGSAFSRKEIYDRLRHLPPNKSLRTTWQYNNLMFMTAGVLTERISGSTWEQFVSTNLFQPLGMSNSNFSVKDMAASKDAALGYRTKARKENIRMDYRNIDAVGPAGSINSSVNDMLKWVQFHLDEGKAGGKQVLSAAEIARLRLPVMLMNESGTEKTPEITDYTYGLGWFIYRYKGLRVVEHGGNIDGFSALVFMVPEKEFGLVVLTNQNASGAPTLLARYATDLVLGLAPTDWYARIYAEGDKQEAEKKDDKKPEPKRVAGTQPSHSLSEYAGEYEHPGYGIIEVKHDEKGLRMKFNSFSLALEHWHYDVFSAKDEDLEMTVMLNFQTDQNGNIYQLTTSTDPLVDDMAFKKTPPRRLSDPVFLQRLTGKYTIEEGNTPITFELRHETLYLKIPGQPEYTLEPFQGIEFKLKGLNGYSIAFELDDKDKVTGASFVQPNGVFKARRE